MKTYNNHQIFTMWVDTKKNTSQQNRTQYNLHLAWTCRSTTMYTQHHTVARPNNYKPPHR
eukprot:1876410-Amphidinium_carterae.2